MSVPKCRVYSIDRNILKARGCNDFGKSPSLFSGASVKIDGGRTTQEEVTVGYLVSAQCKQCQAGMWYYDVEIEYNPRHLAVMVGSILTITSEHIIESALKSNGQKPAGEVLGDRLQEMSMGAL